MVLFEAWMKKTFGRVRSAEGMVGRQPLADVTANGVGFSCLYSGLLFGLLLGFLLFQANLIFSNERTELGIVVLLAVQRIVQWAFWMFF
jgi:hypothetical protein